MAIKQRRAAQVIESYFSRRPIPPGFNGPPPGDFASRLEALEARRQSPLERGRAWSPDIAAGRTGAPAPWLSGVGNRPEAFARADQARFEAIQEQRGRQTAPIQTPSGGATSGWGMSHDPNFGGEHKPFFNEEQGQDLSFQATQQGGDPWFNPHQRATRLAENFSAMGIRRPNEDRKNNSPFGL